MLHSGLFVEGYEHSEARIAEGVIALVLLVGLGFVVSRPRTARRAALLSQSFALVGTLVGMVTIIIGVGPQSNLDIVIHVFLVVLLAFGLMKAYSHLN